MIGCILAIIICAVGLTDGIIGGKAVISVIWAAALAMWVVNLVSTVWP